MLPNDLLNWLTSQLTYLVPLLSVIVAAVAAFFSYKSAKASLLAHEAKLLREFSVHYARPEFSEHLRNLRSWLERHGTESGEYFLTMLKSNDPFAVSVDEARRAVKFHFEDAAKLGRSKYLRKGAVQQICCEAGMDLYFDVAIPLTLAMNPKLDLASHNFLRKLKLRRHDSIQRIR
ncbi:hypothetical protein [uncultured Hyphomonas sp.]|uniref:hypothetical protein n=1 Tax=uncultured Hyphomonas sp. TaxID=225298 RepID=UPI002AAB4DD8|nr:hypothetical protein [uncultured Hyphomonas sp.]